MWLPHHVTPHTVRARRGARRFLPLFLLLGLLVPLLGSPPAQAHGSRLALEVLSSPRADMVSGGDVLLGLDGSGRGVELRVNGRRVRADWQRTHDGAQALVDGLREGRNLITARDGRRSASLVVTNHPRQGPMFAGPHQQPFICSVQDFTTLAGSKLGTPDADCAVPTKVERIYRGTDDAWHPLADPANRPADLATVTLPDGREVPYVVRIETGVINRSIYEVAVLDDASTRNQKLIYNFGGGCPGGWYQQGAGTAGVADDHLLSRGYAVASASLNVMGNNCNPVSAAETMAMVKEHVVETLGVPALTIGTGCSGGSYQVFMIADNYPGLLDAILAGCVFPEVAFATLHTITDALLLDHFFASATGWTDEQKRAASGFAKVGTIANLAGGGRRIDPRVYCPAVLPTDQRYDPQANPDGARCDVYSAQINIWGDSGEGVPRRPLDNTGIQYGLQAWRDGTISTDQFLELNASIGGFDADANVVAARTRADRRAVDTAYRTGQLTNGGGGLAHTPIIELREYTDELPNGDIHLKFHSFSFRERLRKANGDAGNHVMWSESLGHGGFGTANAKYRAAIELLDRWGMANKSAGASHRSVLRTRPAAATDACWSPDDSTKVVQRQTDGIGTNQCNTWYPAYPSPRQVAGAPVVNDVIICAKETPKRRDYPAMTDRQWTRLRAVFAGGVCDWDRRGVRQRGLAGEWPTF